MPPPADRPSFAVEIVPAPEDIDQLGHVNNAVYVQWLEQCAWAHSAAVGLPLARCVMLNRGMAVRRTEVDYLRAAQRSDTLAVGNWVTSVSRLRAERRFEIFRLSDQARLLLARLEYVCINLQTGAPTRFPDAFEQGYVVLPTVRALLPEV